MLSAKKMAAFRDGRPCRWLGNADIGEHVILPARDQCRGASGRVRNEFARISEASATEWR
jgi:hypothetical protein